MRRGYFGVMFVLALLVSSVASAQTRVPFGSNPSLAWDPPTNERAADILVDNYQVNQDGGAFVNAGVTVPSASYTFAIPAAWRTVGTHTLSVKACRGTVCGTPLTVQYIQDPQMQTPGMPTNPRIVVPPGAVGVAVNGTINRFFKEKGLDVAAIAAEGGGEVLVAQQGLRSLGDGFAPRVGDSAGVVVWRPVQ